MRYLVDTDWIIDALGNKYGADASLASHRDEGLAVSLITLGELYEGAYDSHKPEQHFAALQGILALFEILPLTDATMHRFASLRATLRRQGNLIPDLDLLIASTALDHGLILMTRNHKHFERVQGLDLYPTDGTLGTSC